MSSVFNQPFLVSLPRSITTALFRVFRAPLAQDRRPTARHHRAVMTILKAAAVSLSSHLFGTPIRPRNDTSRCLAVNMGSCCQGWIKPGDDLSLRHFGGQKMRARLNGDSLEVEVRFPRGSFASSSSSSACEYSEVLGFIPQFV